MISRTNSISYSSGITAFTRNPENGKFNKDMNSARKDLRKGEDSGKGQLAPWSAEGAKRLGEENRTWTIIKWSWWNENIRKPSIQLYGNFRGHDLTASSKRSWITAHYRPTCFHLELEQTIFWNRSYSNNTLMQIRLHEWHTPNKPSRQLNRSWKLFTLRLFIPVGIRTSYLAFST